MNKEDLLQILSNTESYNIEKTISTDNMDKFCQAICTFSNDISGNGKNGYLISGAQDKEYLPKAVAEDILAEDKRSVEEQLISLGFYDLHYETHLLLKQ